MTARNVIASLTMLLLGCVCAWAQTASQPVTQPTPVITPASTDDATTGMISGSVVSETGQPLAGVQVSIRAMNSPSQGRMSTTDSDGNFRVNGLAPALYFVSASAPAYVTQPSDPNSPPVH